MTTSPLIPASSTSSPLTSSSNTSQTAAGNLNLNSQDFIKMMVTQLQNQDPLQPTSNSELLSQMSQIGQLQASTQLQTSLTAMVLQNQIASAGNLIGKQVAGTDPTSQTPISGVVTSVNVANNAVTLNLDNGASLALNNVTSIGGTASSATTTPTTPTTTHS